MIASSKMPTKVSTRGIAPHRLSFRGPHDLLKVAVLDDDRDTASSIADLLTKQGFVASAFTHPETLEAAARQQGFAAFVLDWILGDTTAADLIVKLRADPALAHAPIFLLSGNLAVAGVPHDPELVSTIRQYRLQFRSKPYSSVLLAQDLATALALVTPS